MNLFISDLDKTLLNDKAQLSIYAREELNKMIDDGLQFTIATARSHVSSKIILEGLNLQLPVIVANGSFITDFKSGEIFFMQNISDTIKKELLLDILSFNAFPFVSICDKEQKNKLYFSKINNEGTKWYENELIVTNDYRRTQVENIEEVIEHKIISCTVIDTEEKIKKILNCINHKYTDFIEAHYYENPYHKGWFWLSIHHANSSKKNAIQQLIEHSTFQQNNITVFGDNVNDLPMFEYAKNRIAVQNAIPLLHEKATHICKSNQENGVVEYIKGKFYG